MSKYEAVALLFVVNQANVALPAAKSVLKERKQTKNDFSLMDFNLLERKSAMPFSFSLQAATGYPWLDPLVLRRRIAPGLRFTCVILLIFYYIINSY